MRKRFNIVTVAIVLAIGSFAFARYRYVDKNSATVSSPFNGDSITLKNPLRDKSLFGDWMKDELVFAIIVPIALIAAGVVLAVRK
jgi:hypothetical protein